MNKVKMKFVGIDNKNEGEKYTSLGTDLNCPTCQNKLFWVWMKKSDAVLTCKNSHKFSKVIPVIPIEEKSVENIIYTDKFAFHILS